VCSLAQLPNGDLIAGGYGGNLRLARWNGTTWSDLGVNGYVLALAVLPNGELWAGGQFVSAGTIGARNIARWNGVTWSPLGTGFSDSVRASGDDAEW
jgi:hypothetical protein